MTGLRNAMRPTRMFKERVGKFAPSDERLQKFRVEVRGLVGVEVLWEYATIDKAGGKTFWTTRDKRFEGVVVRIDDIEETR